MTTFDDRAYGHEAKFAHEGEREFKILARRNKLLGLWVANRLHLSEEEVEKYALNLVGEYVAKPSDARLVEKVVGDFSKAGVHVQAAEVEDQMERYHRLAEDQVANR